MGCFGDMECGTMWYRYVFHGRLTEAIKVCQIHVELLLHQEPLLWPHLKPNKPYATVLTPAPIVRILHLTARDMYKK